MVAYPFGDMGIDCKKKEIEAVIDKGCDAIDVVVNMSYLKSGRYEEFKDEVFTLVDYARSLKKDLEIKPLVENRIMHGRAAHCCFANGQGIRGRLH